MKEFQIELVSLSSGLSPSAARLPHPAAVAGPTGPRCSGEDSKAGWPDRGRLQTRSTETDETSRAEAERRVG